MKNMFLALAIIGAIVPYAFFLPFMAENGLAVTTFITALFANGAAGGFTADLLITSFAFWVYLIWSKTDQVWVYVVLNLTIGLSCALPFYFYRQVAASAD